MDIYSTEWQLQSSFTTSDFICFSCLWCVLLICLQKALLVCPRLTGSDHWASAGPRFKLQIVWETAAKRYSCTLSVLSCSCSATWGQILVSSDRLVSNQQQSFTSVSIHKSSLPPCSKILNNKTLKKKKIVIKEKSVHHKATFNTLIWPPSVTLWPRQWPSDDFSSRCEKRCEIQQIL